MERSSMKSKITEDHDCWRLKYNNKNAKEKRNLSHLIETQVIKEKIEM